MSLEEINQIIDEPKFIVTHEYDNKVIPLFKAFAEEKIKAGEIELAKKAQVEIDVQNFVISENKLRPTLTQTNSKGEYVEYPSLKLWTDDDYDYLIKRQQQTKNAYLKIKYSHILWLSPKKHMKYASDALVQYGKTIRILNKTIWDNGGNSDVHLLKLNISNAFFLALSTQSINEIIKAKKIVLSIARKFRYKSEKSYVNIGLIQLMLDAPKVFKQTDFKDLDKSSLKYASLQTSHHSRIDILIVAQKVAIKLGLSPLVYNENIAKAYEELSYQREDATNLAAITFCQNSIKYYKKSKNKQKVAELEERYKSLKKSMQFGSVSHSIDLTEIIKETKKISDEVLKGSTDSIIGFLMYSPYIFPSYEQLHKQAVERKQDTFLLSFFPASMTDEFGHTSAHYSEDDEKLHLSIMQSFGYAISMSSLLLLHEVIFRAIQMDKLSSSKVIKFLQTNSWLGQDIKITYQQNQEHVFNWLQTLAPGINDFFSQISFLYQNLINTPNFVLAIDSLSIKIEGILRDICDMRGVTTFFQSQDVKGRTIVKEKDINALLREDIIKETLTKEDLLLLQFLLVEKAGLNLRNKVAHTLIRKADGYTLDYILLLIVSILKLAKNEYASPLVSKST